MPRNNGIPNPNYVMNLIMIYDGFLHAFSSYHKSLAAEIEPHILATK